jgi:hypothetical protein
VKLKKRHVNLPIGRTALIACELDAARAACSRAASKLLKQRVVDEGELEECARLDDALAQAHRLLKSTVRSIMLSRLQRRTRSRRPRV